MSRLARFRSTGRSAHAGHPLVASALAAGLTLAAGQPVRAQAQATAQSTMSGSISGSFTPAQRADIVAIVRDALKTDPSILGDAIVALRASAQQRQAADAGAAVRANRAALSGQPGDAILGNPQGDVTVVEFYDPRCPYCRKELPDLDALLNADRQVRVVEKLIPILGPNSVLDAQAIQAASQQGKYTVLQRALMTDSGTPGPDRIRTIATAAGLDTARLLRDMKSPEVNAVLDRNVALARTLQLTGTPSFVIGDQAIPGAIELADLRQAIKAERTPR